MTHFSTSLISHINPLCSFTLSHPLCFCFCFTLFIFFFFPYLLSFLCPLFITTSLSLLALLALLSPAVFIRRKLLAERDKVSAQLSVSFDDESESESEFEELFDLGNFDENRIVLGEESLMNVREIRVEFLEGKSTGSLGDSATAAAMKERRLEDLMKEFEDDKVEGRGAKADKVVVETQKENQNINNGGGGNDTSINAGIWRTLDHNVENRHGNRRKEREWKRTLACKLYEERNEAMDTNSEGMDLLWETYEMETKIKEKQDKDSKKKNEKDSEEEEDDEEMDEKLCCLQALKLSAGKMNSGMGRPNLMKISKAIKRFGWLKNVSKKVHSGDIHIQKKV